MTNTVIATTFFINKVKPLSKKFHTLQKSLEQLEADLIKNPYSGSHYGSKIYKVRLADPSKGKGKSGGFRVVTYVVETKPDSTKIFLVTIFDKSEEETIKKPEVLDIIKRCGL